MAHTPDSSIDVEPDRLATVLPAHVDASPQHRMQALSLAMQYYMPRSEKSYTFVHFTDVAVLATITPKQPALISALGTLSLVQIGTACNDDRLLEESRHTYGLTLRELMITLAHSGARAYHDSEVIATISVLVFCEVGVDSPSSTAGLTDSVL